MNLAHFHLVSTHFAVLGVVFGVLLLLWGRWRGSDDVDRVALGVLLIATVATLPAYFTGAPAERNLKQLVAGIRSETVEQHAEIAQAALALTLIMGATAFGGLAVFQRPRPLPASLVKVLVLLAVVSGGFLGWTANLGGRIHHPEIQSRTQP